MDAKLKRIFYGTYGEFDNLNSPIELTRLAQITDEDAIEVARKLCFYYEHDVLFVVERTYQYVTVVSNSFGNIYIWFDCEITYQYDDLNILAYLDAYDFLRSKGYALPFMGLSVEQMVAAGWIKLRKGEGHE